MSIYGNRPTIDDIDWFRTNIPVDATTPKDKCWFPCGKKISIGDKIVFCWYGLGERDFERAHLTCAQKNKKHPKYVEDESLWVDRVKSAIEQREKERIADIPTPHDYTAYIEDNTVYIDDQKMYEDPNSRGRQSVATFLNQLELVARVAYDEVVRRGKPIKFNNNNPLGIVHE